MVNARLSEKLSLNVGLRAENTSSLGELLSANPGPEDVVPRNYTNLFPNVSLAYNDQEKYIIMKVTGGNVEGAIIDLSANIFNFRIQNNFRLPLGIRMELTGYYTSPWIWRGTVNVDGYVRIDAGLRRSFLDDRLMLQASVNDLFDTGSNYYYKSDYGGMIVDGVNF